MDLSKFIAINKRFWEGWKEGESGDVVLVETNPHPVINHANAIVGKVVARALGIRIAWLNATHGTLMRSYSAGSVFWNDPHVSLARKVMILCEATLLYLGFITESGKLLSFKYRGVTYGDIVYDVYLAQYRQATLHKLDLRLVLVFFSIMLADFRARDLLNERVKAVVLSHHIGSTGPLARVALQRKIKVYWKGGGDGVLALSVFKSLKDIYKFPLKPEPREVSEIVKTFPKEKIELDYRKLVADIMGGKVRDAARKAYAQASVRMGKKKLFEKFGWAKGQPLAYVMLHAFNDHPHSQFGKMLFGDYYDWFIKTLEFAKEHDQKYWLFKEHPYNKLYKTLDIDLKQEMSNLPKHIKFLPADESLSTQTVLDTADVVITCLGSIGIELAAFAGKKAIVGGNSAYSGLGLAIEPKTIREYFDLLTTPPNIRLNKKNQLRAKVAYLYIKRYTSLPFNAAPVLTVEQVVGLQGSRLANDFYDQIIRRYRRKKSVILGELMQYMLQVKKKNFSRLVETDIWGIRP
jgi:hypothetical protein